MDPEANMDVMKNITKKLIVIFGLGIVRFFNILSVFEILYKLIISHLKRLSLISLITD